MNTTLDFNMCDIERSDLNIQAGCVDRPESSVLIERHPHRGEHPLWPAAGLLICIMGGIMTAIFTCRGRVMRSRLAHRDFRGVAMEPMTPCLRV